MAASVGAEIASRKSVDFVSLFQLTKKPRPVESTSAGGFDGSLLRLLLFFLRLRLLITFLRSRGFLFRSELFAGFRLLTGRRFGVAVRRLRRRRAPSDCGIPLADPDSGRLFSGRAVLGSVARACDPLVSVPGFEGFGTLRSLDTLRRRRPARLPCGNPSERPLACSVNWPKATSDQPCHLPTSLTSVAHVTCLRGRSNCRFAVVVLRKHLRIALRRLYLLSLRCCGFHMVCTASLRLWAVGLA